MAVIADFAVLVSGERHLRLDRHLNLPFTLGETSRVDQAGLVMFTGDLHQVENMSFRIDVNGSTLWTYTGANGTGTQTGLAALPKGVLRHGANALNFEVLSGRGVIEFGSVAIFWQKEA